MDRVEQMKKVQEEGLKLFERKNKDYGEPSQHMER